MGPECCKRIWIILPLLIFSVSGCLSCSGDAGGSDSGPISCATDDDCLPGMYCVGGLCESFPDDDGCVNATDGAECGSRYCNGLEYWRLTCQSNSCSGNEPVQNCDDGEDCTSDQCVDETGCQNTNLSTGAPCGDQGVPCRADDTCDGTGSCLDNGNSLEHGDCPLCQKCEAGSCVSQNGEAGSLSSWPYRSRLATIPSSRPGSRRQVYQIANKSPLGHSTSAGQWLCLENKGPLESGGIFTYWRGPWK